MPFGRGGAFRGAGPGQGRALERGAAHLKGGGALGRGLEIISVGLPFVYEIGEVLFCGDC